MSKTRCKQKKKKDVKKPKFQCEKCSELAKKKDKLCQPAKIKN